MKHNRALITFSLFAVLCLSSCQSGDAAEPEVTDIAEIVTTTAPPVETTVTETTVTTEPPAPDPVPVQLGDVLETTSDTPELDISGIDVSELDMDAFLDAMTGLEKITMKDCGLDNDGYAALQDAHPNVKIIWDIHMQTYTVSTDAVAFSALLGDEYQARLVDEDIKYFKYCTDMVALDLGHHHISDISFLEYMPQLRVFILVDNCYDLQTGDRLFDISPLQNTPHLRYLELFNNHIKDMSVLEKLTELEDLNLCYNPVESTKAFRSLPNLKKLWVYATSIPEEELAALHDLYPDATVVTEGWGSVDQGWREGERYEAMRNMVINNVIDDVYKFD